MQAGLDYVVVNYDPRYSHEIARCIGNKLDDAMPTTSGLGFLHESVHVVFIRSTGTIQW